MATVAVLGGGVAGLSAAHELGERGFDVDVYERGGDGFGGKARSFPVPNSATGGRKPLPAEHGFRFFPGFYRHVTDTMRRIPTAGGDVEKHLVPATEILMAQAGRRNEIVAPADLPDTVEDLPGLMRFLWDFALTMRVPPQDLTYFVGRLIGLLLSCDERRYEQWEYESWWEFVGAERRSEKYRKFLADGLTRTLVAAQAKQMSARTGGLILWQILFDMVHADRRVDRLLDGPTSEVWIDPWVSRLEELGVRLHLDREVVEIGCDGEQITHVVVDGQNIERRRIEADFYVAAMPVERLSVLVTPALKAAEPQLAGLERLITRWMNGVVFYLDRDVPLRHGHTIFIDSEWALTAISQPQFWRDVNLAERGNGTVKGILSVDVSDWYTPGRRTGKPASQCSLREIRTEVWGQMLDHIDDGQLDEANIVDWFLDPAIRFPYAAVVTNEEPLLVNTAGSWQDRPTATTAIPNLFLAADFIQTGTDLATMEAANEAARRAVNGILDATASDAPRCEVWPMYEPSVLSPLRELDKLRWRGERSVGRLLTVGQDTAVKVAKVLPDALTAPWRLL